MIFLHTGLPGHGKTLNTLKEVDAASFDTGRPVYYNNITDLDASKLKGEWYPFEDPHKWFELPENCIIVIDECQHFFQPRDVRKERPDYIAHFQTHRHRGYDVHLVTQDFRFIDVEVRRLVGNHVHYWRPWGMTKVARYEYEKVTDFEKVSEREFAKKTYCTIDKNFFGAYKSAVGHHVKVKLPMKVMAIPVVLGFVLYACYRVYDRLVNPNGEAVEAVATETTNQSVGQGMLNSVASVVGFTPPGDVGSPGAAGLTTAQYIDRQLPRVPDLPASAPIFDELTRPVSYPRLYCMSSTDQRNVDRARARQQAVRYINDTLTTCQCYTQQGTRYSTDFDFCMKSSTEGHFDPAVPDRSVSNGMQPQQQQAQPQSERSQSAPVTVTNYQKGRFLW